MKVQTVDVTIAVGKESKDVADVLAELVKDIRDGKTIGALAENIGGIIKAVDGYEMLDDEQRHESKHGTRAYLSMKISEALDYKKSDMPTQDVSAEVKQGKYYEKT